MIDPRTGYIEEDWTARLAADAGVASFSCHGLHACPARRARHLPRL